MSYLCYAASSSGLPVSSSAAYKALLKRTSLTCRLQEKLAPSNLSQLRLTSAKMTVGDKNSFFGVAPDRHRYPEARDGFKTGRGSRDRHQIDPRLENERSQSFILLGGRVGRHHRRLLPPALQPGLLCAPSESLYRKCRLLSVLSRDAAVLRVRVLLGDRDRP